MRADLFDDLFDDLMESMREAAAHAAAMRRGRGRKTLVVSGVRCPVLEWAVRLADYGVGRAEDVSADAALFDYALCVAPGTGRVFLATIDRKDLSAMVSSHNPDDGRPIIEELEILRGVAHAR